MSDPTDVVAVPRRPWWHWIVEYNPFYLLSAVAMLAGVGALSNTTTWEPVPLSRLLPLLATLQAYEVACLAVGVWLFRTLGPRRDALQLLALVALFAVDVSFLMSEIATAHLGVGVAVAGGLLALAVAKAAIVLAIVRPRLTPAAVVVGMAGLVALHAVPPLLTRLDGEGGGVTTATFYALWWLIGLSPLLHDLASWAWRGTWGERDGRWWPRLVAATPWASLAVHLGVLHYVYDRPFLAAHAAPLLIGLAVLLRHGGPMPLRVLLPVAAALVSWNSPAQLEVGPVDSATISGVAAWLALAYVTLPRLVPYFAAVAVVAGLWRAFGPSASQVMAGLRATFDTAVALVPRSQRAWGVVGVAAAFVLLAAGVAMSLLRRDRTAS